MTVGDRVALDGRAGVVAALTATTPGGCTWWQVRLDGEDEVRSARQSDLQALEPEPRSAAQLANDERQRQRFKKEHAARKAAKKRNYSYTEAGGRASED